MKHQCKKTHLKTKQRNTRESKNMFFSKEHPWFSSWFSGGYVFHITHYSKWGNKFWFCHSLCKVHVLNKFPALPKWLPLTGNVSGTNNPLTLPFQTYQANMCGMSQHWSGRNWSAPSDPSDHWGFTVQFMGQPDPRMDLRLLPIGLKHSWMGLRRRGSSDLCSSSPKHWKYPGSDWPLRSPWYFNEDVLQPLPSW